MRLSTQILMVVAIAVFAVIGLLVMGWSPIDAFMDANRQSKGWLGLFVYMGWPFLLGGIVVLLIVFAMILIAIRATASRAAQKAPERDRYGIKGSMDRGD